MTCAAEAADVCIGRRNPSRSIYNVKIYNNPLCCLCELALVVKRLAEACRCSSTPCLTKYLDTFMQMCSALVYMSIVNTLLSCLVRFCTEQQVIDWFLLLAEQLAASTANTIDDALVITLQRALRPQESPKIPDEPLKHE